MLSGLSARSFGNFAEFVTRIAAGRVTRSLPNALRPCGYRSFSVYPWLGAFLGARGFQKTLGIDHFLDAKDLDSKEVETDEFYYDYAAEPDRARKSQRPGVRAELPDGQSFSVELTAGGPIWRRTGRTPATAPPMVTASTNICAGRRSARAPTRASSSGSSATFPASRS